MHVFKNIVASFSWRLALLFIFLGVLAALVAEFAVTDYDHAGSVQSHDGLRLRYETQGTGPPLVALAGGPGISHNGFHPYLERLGSFATVIYFDPRGRGASDPATSYSVHDDVRDLEALRKALRLEQIDLLGVSYGAHLALAFALDHPQHVGKLVLVSPVVGRSAWGAHLHILLEAPGMEGVLKRLRQEHREVLLSDVDTSETIVRALLPLYWCRPEDSRRHSSPSRRRHRIARQNFDVYEAIIGRPFGELNGDMATSDVESGLAAIEASVLIVQGECDRVVPEGHVDWLVRRLPQARKKVFKEAGHSPYVDQPERFIEVVVDFLLDDTQ
jgi:proline iminopeptidase